MIQLIPRKWLMDKPTCALQEDVYCHSPSYFRLMGHPIKRKRECLEFENCGSKDKEEALSSLKTLRKENPTFKIWIEELTFIDGDLDEVNALDD